MALTKLPWRAAGGAEVAEVPGGRFVFFSDLDGNTWAVQEITVPQG